MFCNKCGKNIEQDSKFCTNCGNPVTYDIPSREPVNVPNVPIQNKEPVITPSPVKKSNKKSILIGSCIGFAAVLITFTILLIIGVSNSRNSYYFNVEQGAMNNENLSGAVQNTGSSARTGKYSTQIIYDNTYTGVTIKSSKDATDLIIKDSVSQKDNCPQEIKDIENSIIQNYGITAVNLCELDVEFARELENVINTVYSQYPSAREYLTNMSLANVSMAENYIAAFMPIFPFAESNSVTSYPYVIKTQVLLNTSYFLNVSRLESSVKDGSNSGHFPKNTTRYSPVAHELGHYLSFIAMMKYYKIDSILLVDENNISTINSLSSDFASGSYSLSMIKEAYNNYKRDTNTTLSLDEWRSTISKYAMAKDNSGNYIYDETIAESFHDVYLNGDNAADASKYVVQVLKSKLGN